MTANVNKWSKTAATNATADPDINWAEGQAPSTVNNSARAVMQGVANLRDDQGGQLTLAGGTTAYTLTTNSGAAAAYADGQRWHAVVNVANAGTNDTLSVDGLGAKRLYKASSTGMVVLAASDMVVDMHAIFEYDTSLNAASGGIVLCNPYPTAATSPWNYTGVADTNATMAAGKYEYIWTTLTAARTSTLLAASAYTAGQILWLEDGANAASSTVTITATVNPTPGTDTIVGDAAVNSPRGRLMLICDGVSKFYGKLIRAFGTSAMQAIALDSAAKLPAVDGSQLTNISVGISAPGGRLTLTSGTPVLTSTVAAAATIYYTPYQSQYIPIYNGSVFVATDTGGELSNATAQSSTGKAGPAAVTTNSNYDLFVWSDSGTIRLTRGPLWTSDTARGSGAGTTELTRVKGVLVNANAITNGPGANLGTYVGTVRSNGTSTIDYQLGALASNGTAGIVGVWNMYNRVNVSMFVQDSTDSWNYASATIRAANASSTMRVSFVCGFAEDGISASYKALTVGIAAGRISMIGLGYDSTTAIASGSTSDLSTATTASTQVGMIATFQKAADIGFHYVQALESNPAASTITFYGDNGSATTTQTGLSFNFRA